MDLNQELEKSKILEILKGKEEIDSESLSNIMKVDHQQVIGLIKGLEIKEIINSVKKEKKYIILTDGGKDCLEKGGPDFQILKEIKQNGAQSKKDLILKLGNNVMNYGFQ